MWIPESAVKTLVDSISDIIKHKPHLIGADVREKLLELKSQLEKLRLLMPNFFDSDAHFPFTEILEGCEDAVDCVYSAARRRRSTLCRMLLTDAMSRRHQIGKAKRQIKEAGETVKRFNAEIMNNGNHDQVLHSRDQAIMVNLDPALNFPTASKAGEERVIGFDEAAAAVVGLLTTGAENLEAVSIVAISGMGKTVLAKMVCNDDEVQSQYKIRAFVHVSMEFDRREVLLKILSCFTLSKDKVTKRMDEDELAKQVYQQLEGKQYLIVLDDVWLKGAWNSLRDAFPDNIDKRCRVLITTRNYELAKQVNRNPESIYWLKCLTPESSRELLRWRVFGENNCPVELREYESDIVKQSQGVPLVLLSTATMLMKHLDLAEWWKKVVDSLSANFDGFVLETWAVVEGAYMHLPNHLKPCLLYFVALSTDSDIPVWKLLRLWISEGFIMHDDQEGDSRNLEDIAEQYLEELVDRNFLMVSERRSNGRIRKCNINNSLSDICKIRAAKENLILSFNSRRIDGDPNISNTRRIAIDAGNLEVFSGTASRSLLMFSRSKMELDLESVSCIPKRFKLLKVLDAESLFFTTLPVQFWSLVLLKYVAISGNIESLPSTLYGLWSLQTLIVNTTSPTLQIEADIWKMPHFRHLHTNATTTFPCHITTEDQQTEDDNSNVQTLCYISPECCKNEVFHRTIKLRKLGIRGTLTELFESSLLECLHKLEYLENLKLLNCSNSPCLPPKISLPKQLTKLTFSNTRLDWKEMRTLGELQKLEVLKLKEYAFRGEQWETENGGFLHLKHLHIGHTDLTVWKASADDFPQLRSLEISGCNELRHIPRDMADIQSLQSVRLRGSTSSGVAYSLKRIRVVKFLQTNKKNFEISVFPPQE